MEPNSHPPSARAATRPHEARAEPSHRLMLLGLLGTTTRQLAHDMNNFLFVMLGRAELLLARHRDDPALVRNLEEILDAGEQATALNKQVLLASRDAAPEPEPVCVGRLVREAAPLLRSTVGPDATLEIRIEPSRLCVITDAVKLHQILLNLVMNALQALPERDGRVELTVRERKSDGDEVWPKGLERTRAYIQITVSDNGHGMDSKVAGAIFEPGFTTRPGRGHGLGLANVGRIVAELKGRAQVDSQPGDGTRFDIFLPAAEVAPPPRRSKAETAHTADGTRVLLVDDDIRVLHISHRWLADEGYNVLTTTDGREAEALMRDRRDHFDLLVTDYDMPALTGLELARGARTVDPDLPILLLTGYGTEVDLTVAGLGELEILDKPCTRLQLARAASRALSGPTASAR